MKTYALLLLSMLAAADAQGQTISLQGTNLGAIPDGAGPGPNNYGAPRDVRFPVNAPGTAQDVRFQIQAAHPFVGDLKVTLISPQGIEHLAFERTGATTATATGSPANLVLVPGQGYVFRDDSANNWWTVAGTANADIAPSDARTVIAGPTTAPAAVTSINATFADRPVAGTWVLRFEDGWSGDIGNVTGVTLQITPRSATLAVTKVEDTDDGACNSDCSLREAIAAATPGQQIVFATPFFDAPRTLFLDAELLVDKNLAISGPGAHRLTISAANRSRVFRVTGSRVTLANMRISDGVGADAGCVSAQGGALVLHRVEVSNCRASGVSSIGAGGVYQSGSGSLLLSESSVTGNQGLGSSTAGGLAAAGAARILRSTISGNLINSTFGDSSAAISSASSNLTVIDSTITDNIVRGASQAAGIVQGGSGRLTISNSVVAGNVGGNADIVLFNASTLVSGGFNAIGRVGSLAAAFNQAGDQSGTGASPLDPVLSPLSYHGGTVPVHVPLPGSPLLDKGKSARATDVRGVPLVDLAIEPAAGGNDADIGAVELSPILVENLSFNDPGSLRQALQNAPAAPAVTDILFDPALTVTPATLRFGTQISIDRNVSIHGPGAQRLTLNGARQARVLTVLADRLVSISGLTLADGNGNSRDNTEPGPGTGGVVFNAAGSHLSIINSVISGGRSDVGSAVENRGALLLRGSTITGSAGSSNNSTVINARSSSTTLIELSTISGNRGSALGLSQASATLLRSTIHANAGTSAIDAFVSPAFLFGNIIAGQRSGNDFSANSNRIISGGFNFIGNPGTSTAFNQTGDQAGTSAVPLDPLLSPLAVYSGQVPVHMPLANSFSVIDRGLGRIRDQRGLALFDTPTFSAASGGDHSDIGATEAQVQLVNTSGDAGPGTLRQALLNANANGPGVDDVLLVGFGRVDLTGALPTLTGSTNLVGPGPASLTITRAAGAPDFGLITAVGPAQPGRPIHLGISGVTLSAGRDTGADGGGAIDANQAELHMSEVEVINSTGINESAGGVSLFFGDGVVQNSTFSNNAGTVGGALHFEGRNNRLRVEQATFSGNSAENGAAIHVVANADNGPPAEARLELLSSTLADNTASSFGGAILAVGRNGNPSATAPVTMKNTLLRNNGATAIVALFAPNFTSQGHNISNIALPQLTATGDASPANTGLDPLANNGGPVRTRAPRGGSSALDRGFSSNAFFDARGLVRQLDLPTITNFEFGDASDIGAVEAQTAPAAVPEAPIAAYNPNSGGGVSFTPFDVSTNRGFISAASSGGVAPGSVRLNACSATAGFSIVNGPIDLLGTAGGSQIDGLIDLRCAPNASVQTGTLTCTETSNPGSAIQRTWNLSCPAADSVPPALTFNPTAGTTINYAATGTASPIVVTPSGGIGVGPLATTTLSECVITNGGAAFPTTAVASLSFIGATTTAQNLGLPNCTAQATATNATLNCVERQGVSTQVNRSWTLGCPEVVPLIFRNGFED